MIVVNNTYGGDFILNSDLIETMESIPETKINLVNGKYFLVSNTKEEIIEKIIEYNKNIYGYDKKITFVQQESDDELDTNLNKISE